MKLVGALSTAVLSLTLGVAAPAYAQQEQHDQQEEQKAKPAQDEKKAHPEKPSKQQEEKSAQQERKTKPEEKNVQQNNSKPEERNAQQNNQQARPEQQGQRAGGNGRGRIPDEHFRANFGQEHRFRVSQGDYDRDRHFRYGGYSFGFVDAWPSNWLYTQDVYVIEIDGVYYLCNPTYPGVNIALSFTL
jgi:hypothetical protein